MLKLSTTLFIIFALLTVSFNVPALAQSQALLQANDSAAPESEKPLSEKHTGNKPDLKKVFADETKKFNATSAEFDPIKIQQQQNQQQAKSKWTKKDKVLLAAVIIGIAVLVFVVVKYGKKCLRSSPANCTPGVDEFCTCEEYEQNN